MSQRVKDNAPPGAPGAAADIKLPAVKAETLRDQILATSGLSGLDADATLTIFAAALLAESDDNYSRDSALGILQRARKISPEDLSAAVQKLTGQLAGAMTAFWTSFIQETWQGQDAPPQYVDPGVVAKRKEAEEQEQDRNRKLALQYLDQAQAAVTALGIDEKEFPQTPLPPKKPILNINLGQVIHKLIYKPVSTTTAPGPNAPPGWLTPPVLDRQAEDVMVFDNDIMDIVASRKLTGDQAWKKLDDRGYDRQRVIRSIYNVRKIAQEQIAQSEQILSFIRSDYANHIEPVVKAAVLLGHAVSVVNSFYAPLPLPPDGDDLKVRPAPSTRRAGSR